MLIGMRRRGLVRDISSLFNYIEEKYRLKWGCKFYLRRNSTHPHNPPRGCLVPRGHSKVCLGVFSKLVLSIEQKI